MARRKKNNFVSGLIKTVCVLAVGGLIWLTTAMFVPVHTYETMHNWKVTQTISGWFQHEDKAPAEDLTDEEQEVEDIVENAIGDVTE